MTKKVVNLTQLLAAALVSIQVNRNQRDEGQPELQQENRSDNTHTHTPAHTDTHTQKTPAHTCTGACPVEFGVTRGHRVLLLVLLLKDMSELLCFL